MLTPIEDLAPCCARYWTPFCSAVELIMGMDDPTIALLPNDESLAHGFQEVIVETTQILHKGLP